MSFHDLSLSLAEALVQAQASSGRRPTPGDGPNGPARRPFTITISREAGALGNSVAAEVGRRLGWPVHDRNILDRIAQKLRRPPAQVEGVDERRVSWLGECLASLFDRYPVEADTYLKHLFAAVRGLGEDGRCVIVGRGANFLLPAETTLRVRLVARPEDRAREVAKRVGFSAKEADAWVKATERERLAFLKDAFKQDPADPHHYDLVLNMSRLSVAEAADVILEALRRFQEREAPAAQAKKEAATASAAT
jgi:cytidylate kinase